MKIAAINNNYYNRAFYGTNKAAKATPQSNEVAFSGKKSNALMLTSLLVLANLGMVGCGPAGEQANLSALPLAGASMKDGMKDFEKNFSYLKINKNEDGSVSVSGKVNQLSRESTLTNMSRATKFDLLLEPNLEDSKAIKGKIKIYTENNGEKSDVLSSEFSAEFESIEYVDGDEEILAITLDNGKKYTVERYSNEEVIIFDEDGKIVDGFKPQPNGSKAYGIAQAVNDVTYALLIILGALGILSYRKRDEDS